MKTAERVETLIVRRDAAGTVIEIPRNYFGRDRFGFWFRVIVCVLILSLVYFLVLPHVAARIPFLRDLPHASLIKYSAFLPLLALFFLLEFMGFSVVLGDATSYFLSLTFYSPRIVVSPQGITIVKRWLLRTKTISIPAEKLRRVETYPWFQFVTPTRTVIVCSGLKREDGKRVRQAVADVFGRDMGGAAPSVHAAKRRSRPHPYAGAIALLVASLIPFTFSALGFYRLHRVGQITYTDERGMNARTVSGREAVIPLVGGLAVGLVVLLVGIRQFPR